MKGLTLRTVKTDPFGLAKFLSQTVSQKGAQLKPCLSNYKRGFLHHVTLYYQSKYFSDDIVLV